MPTDVSIRMGVDGEKEFRSALSAVNAQIKNLNSEMKSVVTSMSGMDNAEEKAAKQTDVLGRSMDATRQKVATISGEYDRQKQKLEQLGNQLDDLLNAQERDEKAITEATIAYNQQSAAVNKLGTQLNDATSDLNRLEREMQDVESGADQTENSVRDMGQAMDAAGNDAESFGDRLRGGFTVAKGIAANLIADGIQMLAGSLANLAGEALDAADSMIKFESTMSFAGFSDAEIDKVSKQAQEYASRTVYDLQTVTNTIAQLGANGVKDYADLTEAAGNLNAVAGGSADTFKSVAMVLTQTAGAGKLTTENWNQLADAIPGASGLLQDAMRENGAYVGNFRDAMEDGEITAEEFNQAIMQLGMSDAAKEAASSTKTIEGAIGNLKATVVDAITSMLTEGGGLTLLTSTINSITQGLSSLITAFQDGGFSGLFAQMSTMVQSLALSIQENMPHFMQVGGEIVLSLIQGIGEMLPVIWDASGQILLEFISGLTEQMPQIVETGMTFIDNLANGVISAVQNLIPAAIDALTTFINELTNNYPTIMEKGVEILNKLVDGIIGAIPDLLAKLPQLITAFVGFIVTSFPTIIKSGKDILLNLISGIINNLFELTNKAPEIIDALIEGLSGLKDRIKAVGKDVLEGLWEGIKSKFGWLKNKCGELKDKVVSFVKEKFGINSPSKVMRDEVGTGIPEGIAVGIEDGIPEVLSAADKLSQALIDEEERLAKELENTGLDEATKTALTNQLNLVKEFRSEYDKALSDIEKSQESMAQKLKDYGDLFETVKTETGSFLELGDLQADIDAIQQYGNALEQLKGRGVSDSLLDEIVGMSVDDATAYTEKLLAMTDEQYAEYMALWEQKQAEAQEIARKFYSDEMDALTDEFVDKIPEELGYVKDEMRSIGVDSIQSMINGMYSKSGALWAAASSIIHQAINAMQMAAGIHSPSKKVAEMVGAPMGEGVAVGFLAGMEEGRKTIENAVMAPISRVSRDDMYNAAAATVNGMAATGIVPNQTVIIPVNLNGKQIAEVIYDPLKQVGRQRGTSLG